MKGQKSFQGVSRFLGQTDQFTKMVRSKETTQAARTPLPLSPTPLRQKSEEKSYAPFPEIEDNNDDAMTTVSDEEKRLADEEKKPAEEEKKLAAEGSTKKGGKKRKTMVTDKKEDEKDKDIQESDLTEARIAKQRELEARNDEMLHRNEMLAKQNERLKAEADKALQKAREWEESRKAAAEERERAKEREEERMNKTREMENTLKQLNEKIDQWKEKEGKKEKTKEERHYAEESDDEFEDMMEEEEEDEEEKKEDKEERRVAVTESDDDDKCSEKDERALQTAKDMVYVYEQEKEEVGRNAFAGKLKSSKLLEVACRALGIDTKGRVLSSPYSENTRTEIKRIQSMVIDIPERRRDGTLCKMAVKAFGVRLHGVPMSFGQKIATIAMLKRTMTLDKTVMQKFIEQAKAEEKLHLPGALWKSNDVLKLKGEALAQAKIEDVLKAPTVWKEYVRVSRDRTAAKKVIMDAIKQKWRDPIRERRKDEMMMMMLHEVEEHLLTIDVLVTPRDGIDDISEFAEVYEAIILRIHERLECCRIWVRTGSVVATLFLRKARQENPDAEKDLEKLEEEARNESKDVPLKRVVGQFRGLAHSGEVRRGRGERPVTFQRSVSAEPEPQRSRSVGAMRSHPQTFSHSPRPPPKWPSRTPQRGFGRSHP